MSTGGKSGGSASSLKDYYASFAAVFAIGPADELVGVVVDGEKLWPSSGTIDLTAQANPYTFDIADRGRVHCYRGTATQTLSDPVLTKAGRSFAPMRHRIVLVFENFLCGRERTSLPDIKIVTRRKPQQSVITGNAANLDTDGQANGLAFAAELITSQIHGAGESADALDPTTWQAIADKLYADRTNQYISPTLRETTSLRTFLSDLNGYNDLWYRVNSAGKIEVGQYAQGEEAPGELVVVTADDLEPNTNPDIVSVTQGELDTRFQLAWTNPALDYDTDPSARFENQLARRRRSLGKPATYQRPWVLRGNQANAMAARLGQRDSTPYDKISGLSIREAKADQIEPGDLFILTLDKKGVTYSKICYMQNMRGWGSDSLYVNCTAEEARGVYPGAAAIDLEAPEFEEEEALIDPAYWHVVQARESSDWSEHSLIPLVGTTVGSASGSNLYFKYKSDEYQFLGSARGFAVPAELADDYPATTGTDDQSGDLLIALKSAPDPLGFSSLPTSMTEDEVQNDNLLAVIISAADTSRVEFCSVRSVESPVSGEYPLHVLRGRQGTRALSFSTGDHVYLILKSQIAAFTHGGVVQAASELDATSRVASLKVAPYSASEAMLPADVSAKSLSLQLTASALSGTLGIGRRVKIFAENQFFLRDAAGDSPADITLLALTQDFANPSLQWYYRDYAGTRHDISGATDASLLVLPSDIPDGTEPDRFKIFGVEVNGVFIDEMSVFLGDNSEPEFISRVLGNEMVTIFVDSSDNPLPGEAGSNGIALSKTKFMIGATQLKYSAAATADPNEYELTLPTGIAANADGEIYLDDPGELTGDQTDFTITFENDSETYTTNFKVRRYNVGDALPRLTLSADGPLVYPQPITPSTLTLTADVTIAEQVIATRDIELEIDEYGGIEFTADPDDNSGIDVSVELRVGSARVECKHVATGVSDYMIVTTEYENNDFVTTWRTTTTSETVKLPVYYAITAGVTGNNVFDVDWGDGSSIESFDTAGDNVTHVYAVAGDYQVKVKEGGTLHSWITYGLTTAQKQKLISVDNWGSVGLKDMQDGFSGCSNLESIPAGMPSSLLTLRFAYTNCTSLTSIPSGLLSGCSSVTDCYKIFNGCTSLDTVPASLFAGMTALTTIESAFEDCASLETIPAGLLGLTAGPVTAKELFVGSGLTAIPDSCFEDETHVSSFYQAFKGLSTLVSIGDNAFDGCSGATTFYQCFEDCTGIETVGDSVFAGCSAVTTFESLFRDCTALTAIGSLAFDACSAATNFAVIFRNCSSLTSIDGGMFSGCSAAVEFGYSFASCSALSSVPGSLFDDCSAATSFNRTFSSCTSLTSVPSGLFDACTNIDELGYCFETCTSLTSVASSLFTTFPSVGDMIYMFAGCSAITSAVPDFWTTHSGWDGNECFDGCVNASNYGSIPSGWR